MTTKEFYDQHASKYLQISRSDVSPLRLINQYSLLSMIGKENISLDNAHIIDIGCGNGVFSKYLASTFPNVNSVTGIDLSDTMIQNAKKHNSHSNKISFYQADIRRLSTLTKQNIELSSYDIAVVMFVFCYASRKQELCSMLENISLLLKPNGIIIGSGPFPDHYRLINAANNESYNKYGVRMYIKDINATKLYDGYKYGADVYAFDESKSEENPKGNFMHFDSGYFYSRKAFNEFGIKFGIKKWKWYNRFIPHIVKQHHQYIDWDKYIHNSPDGCFCARKCLTLHSKL